jgi:hypothetical protein
MCVCVFVFVCVCLYVCACVCVCVCGVAATGTHLCLREFVLQSPAVFLDRGFSLVEWAKQNRSHQPGHGMYPLWK